MSHTYVHLLVHCVFSTKERRGFLTGDVRQALWPYLGGIARNNGMKAIAVGGAEDHCHLLLSIDSKRSIAEAVQRVKGNSSRWLRQRFPGLDKFAWQKGYGAFSIGISQVEDTVRYINAQIAHHRHKTFKEEFLAFLKRHKVDYDPRYIWD